MYPQPYRPGQAYPYYYRPYGPPPGVNFVNYRNFSPPVPPAPAGATGSPPQNRPQNRTNSVKPASTHGTKRKSAHHKKIKKSRFFSLDIRQWTPFASCISSQDDIKSSRRSSSSSQANTNSDTASSVVSTISSSSDALDPSSNLCDAEDMLPIDPNVDYSLLPPVETTAYIIGSSDDAPLQDQVQQLFREQEVERNSESECPAIESVSSSDSNNGPGTTWLYPENNDAILNLNGSTANSDYNNNYNANVPQRSEFFDNPLRRPSLSSSPNRSPIAPPVSANSSPVIRRTSVRNEQIELFPHVTSERFLAHRQSTVVTSRNNFHNNNNNQQPM
jgi:hypothetical protein